MDNKHIRTRTPTLHHINIFTEKNKIFDMLDLL